MSTGSIALMAAAYPCMMAAAYSCIMAAAYNCMTKMCVASSDTRKAHSLISVLLLVAAYQQVLLATRASTTNASP
jgi:hypothetical protein